MPTSGPGPTRVGSSHGMCAPQPGPQPHAGENHHLDRQRAQKTSHQVVELRDRRGIEERRGVVSTSW